MTHTTHGYNKPLPKPNHENIGFWEAAKRHEPVCQRCSQCGTWLWQPLVQCPQCLSFDLGYEKISGLGKLFSYSIVKSTRSKIWSDVVPYVVATVTMEEGIRMKFNLVHCDPEIVKVGMPVKMIFKDVTPDWTLPQFEPCG
jgi:uncharacterized protein